MTDSPPDPPQDGLSPINGKPMESVWDYPRPPRLEAVDYLIEVTHAGVSIARSTSCLRLLETSQPPAYYIPLADISAEVLRPSSGATYCEWKGMAAYADVVVDSVLNNESDTTPEQHIANDAAWTYPDPTGSFADLQGHWAFYAQKLDGCFVDGEKVDPNEGGFYGGWITANVTGPFKGAPGTNHW